ncbi:MAG: alpha/beta hydrolase family protein, partial [Planctomycetota bacterium]
MKRHPTPTAFFVSVLTVSLLFTTNAFAGDGTTYPAVSEKVSPVEFIQLSEHASAAVRKPPGDGPFPAIIFLHGGLGHANANGLKNGAKTGPTQARFLAWGYVTVNATRRAITHDPQDRGVIQDTVDIINAVKAMPHVDADSIVLYGGSGGGTLALEVASHADLAGIAAGEPATIIYMNMFNKSHVITQKGKPTGDRRWDVMNADATA